MHIHTQYTTVRAYALTYWERNFQGIHSMRQQSHAITQDLSKDGAAWALFEDAAVPTNQIASSGCSTVLPWQ